MPMTSKMYEVDRYAGARAVREEQQAVALGTVETIGCYPVCQSPRCFTEASS
ncbi:hypothetical protein [Streptomyces nitrosporeus]|uniref:hypothetical protein n=1 Tax=Streptomyces nitrosporeus TaxID=28894 RepID=UPI00332B54D4